MKPCQNRKCPGFYGCDCPEGTFCPLHVPDRSVKIQRRKRGDSPIIELLRFNRMGAGRLILIRLLSIHIAIRWDRSA